MKVAGIIAEYNPFHKGHAYHIEEVRRRTGADYVIVVMSGSFLQRGGPAMTDKYTRTHMALLGGADLVLELPVTAATASAETFARTGVALLASTGVVTHLGFGCETEDLDSLERLAHLFAQEPPEYQTMLTEGLRQGMNFPAARAQAAEHYLKTLPTNHKAGADNGCAVRMVRTENVFAILASPNNILAIEYLKAIRQLRADMIPCPILRKGNGYHDTALSENYSSATAIRQALLQATAEDCKAILAQGIPAESVEILFDSLNRTALISEEDFSGLLQYQLTMEANSQLSEKGFAHYADVSLELSNRIQNQLEFYTGYNDFIARLKTRNQTYTGISRSLTHILLGIRESHMALLAKLDYAPYLRVLGFKKDASALLVALKDASVPVITKVAEAQLQFSCADTPSCPTDTASSSYTDAKAIAQIRRELLDLDIRSTHVYNLVRQKKSRSLEETASDRPPTATVKSEYRQPLIYI